MKKWKGREGKMKHLIMVAPNGGVRSPFETNNSLEKPFELKENYLIHFLYSTYVCDFS